MTACSKYSRLASGTPGGLGKLRAAWEDGDAQGHTRGYIRGQQDFFLTLTSGADVALHHQLTLQYAVWCLARNVAQVGALQLQFRNSYWDATGFHPGAP